MRDACYLLWGMRTFRDPPGAIGCSRRQALSVLGASALLVACRSKSPAKARLRIAAASDLARAFPEIGAAFTAQVGGAAGVELTFTFGSSGLLSKQIAEGAPFDVFACADLGYVQKLAKDGFALADSLTRYARGRLVVWTRRDAPMHPSAPSDLLDAGYRKIAIANPDHAPYGRAAREALTSAGVLPSAANRLVFGEDVQQALSFATSGNAEVAVIARSLALREDGVSLLVDGNLHAPLEQAAIVTRVAEDASLARRFVAFLAGARSRGILGAHGFDPPVAASAASVASAAPSGP